ncbi:DMT family transporter [Pseudomonas sp. Marseille-P9899]|uniref:DMT family transporter n=1 Tax=Pseudomonas sp. Marseille-P9899 TaxID=2730401 RepID=UPI0015894356|nr:DMT family transporter [Pseudomonas sp. Marseille-P9899]
MNPSFSPVVILLPLIALLAGAAVPFQAGSNAALGRLLGHPLWATLVSLSVSVLMVLPALWLMRAPAPQFAGLGQAPWWTWFGGVAGVAYITAALILTPRLGAAGFIVCVVAGQVLSSLAIDQWGLMGLPERPVNLLRLLGVGLIVAGMLVVQWGTASSR